MLEKGEVVDSPNRNTVIAVTMATSRQGAGVVKELSKTNKYQIRAITRNINSSKALEIGRLNNIKVEEKDTQNAMMQELQRYPGKEKEILDYFKKNPDAQNQLSGQVFEDKIIDFIVELAEVKEKIVNIDELYKEDSIDIKDELKKEKSKKSKPKVSKNK